MDAKTRAPPLRPAPAVHVSDPGLHVPETVDGLQEGEVRRVDDRPIDPSDMGLDRGVQLEQLVRREDVRRTALFVDPQNEGRPGRRLGARAHDGEEHLPGRGIRKDPGDRALGRGRAEQGSGP